MELRPLGRTGVRVPPICLGTLTFGQRCDEATSFAIMDRAYEGGVDFFDTANVYAGTETEKIIGRWMKERGVRENIFLATKCAAPLGPTPNDEGLSRYSIQRAVEASLKRLGTDVIDLYQAHFFDSRTPIEETLRAYDDLVRAGKVRYIGCSNFSAWHLVESHWASDKYNLPRFETVQPRYSMMYREIESELLPYTQESDTGVLVYNPLAAGVLSGKYNPDEAPPEDSRFATMPQGFIRDLLYSRYFQNVQLQAVKDLRDAVEVREISMAALAVAWVINQPAVTSAIVGATKPEQLDETLAAVDLEIDEELAELCDSLWWRLPREPVQPGYW